MHTSFSRFAAISCWRTRRLGDRITISPIDLGTLGGQSTNANAMNDRGQVVGRSETASGESHAFLWHEGVMSDLGTGARSEASDINELGRVVGTRNAAADSPVAFLWDDGMLTMSTHNANRRSVGNPTGS